MTKDTERSHFSLEEEIHLKDILNEIFRRKFLVIGFTVVISLCSVFYSLSLPNIYTSRAVLSPINETDSMSRSSIQGLGNIASLAGVDIGSNSANKPLESIKRLSTLKFFEESFLPNIFLPDLHAVKSWDYGENRVIYDNGIYDINEKEWTRNVAFPLQTEPSSQESFRKFKKIFSIQEDKSTGFWTISIKHQSPYIASDWVNLMAKELNKKVRADDKREANLTISFLNQKMAETNLAEVQQSLSQLLKAQTQKLMLVEAREQYIFKIIDPAVPAEIKSEPKRALICIIGALIGMISGIFFVLFIFFLRKN